ncbi:MAG: response regulator [Syntrophobacterales bacterium]|nr:response regulator [Syntrophobacterales bacterium]
MKKILVVDDHPLTLKFMTNLLEKNGHQVLTAGNSLSALNILKNYVPDVMFIDLIMPNINGEKLCSIIAKMPKLKDTYIIVLSAIASEEIERKLDFAELGINACIAKGPLDKMGENVLAALDQSDLNATSGFTGKVIGAEYIRPRQVTKELLSNKRHYEAILESMDEGILEITADATIIRTNKAAVSMADISEENLLASNFIELFNETDREKVRKLMKSNGTSLHSDERKSTVSLNSKKVELRLVPLKEEKTKTTLVVLNDVTKQKLIEEQIRHTKKMEAIGTLSGGIAHEFNNLLMGIQGNTSLMLLNTKSDDTHYNRLKNIENLIQSGSKLTSQLLGYARKGRYQISPIDLNTLVKDTSYIFAKTKKEIVINQELSTDLHLIEADRGQIEQVLLNLYINAADAMPTGGKLTITTANVTHENMGDGPYTPRPGNYVMLVITDTGIGMDKKTCERVFDPFFTTKEPGSGTGLGLASTYGIIKGHRGYINVESGKGKGTTFKIYLPASKTVVRDYETVAREEQLLAKHETILLVDDEELIREVSREMLEAVGYNVLSAGSGKEAVNVYKKHQDTIDLVVLDLIMPEMGGGQVYDRLKEINPGVKVLLSSGYSINEEAMSIMKRGCDGFIQKPFRIINLSQKIQKILDKG